jgi:hypothetical protein
MSPVRPMCAPGASEARQAIAAQRRHRAGKCASVQALRTPKRPIPEPVAGQRRGTPFASVGGMAPWIVRWIARSFPLIVLLALPAWADEAGGDGRPMLAAAGGIVARASGGSVRWYDQRGQLLGQLPVPGSDESHAGAGVPAEARAAIETERVFDELDLRDADRESEDALDRADDELSLSLRRDAVAERSTRAGAVAAGPRPAAFVVADGDALVAFVAGRVWRLTAAGPALPVGLAPAGLVAVAASRTGAILAAQAAEILVSRDGGRRFALLDRLPRPPLHLVIDPQARFFAAATPDRIDLVPLDAAGRPVAPRFLRPRVPVRDLAACGDGLLVLAEDGVHHTTPEGQDQWMGPAGAQTNWGCGQPALLPALAGAAPEIAPPLRTPWRGILPHLSLLARHTRTDVQRALLVAAVAEWRLGSPGAPAGLPAAPASDAADPPGGEPATAPAGWSPQLDPDARCLERARTHAVELAAAEPERARSLLTRAGRSAWLPELRIRAEHRVGRSESLDYKPTASSDALGLDTDNAVRYEVRATWDLPRLVFNPEEIGAAAQALRINDMRREIESQMNRLYFERRRLLAAPAAAGSPDEINTWQIRVEELEADLDALSGGSFARCRAGKPTELP